MLTLKEAGLIFKCINLLSFVGILPYRCNVAKGKFEVLPFYRLIFWYFCACMYTLHLLNSLSQAVNLYSLSDQIDLPLHIVLIHIMLATIMSIDGILLIFAKAKMHDAIILLFNQLFTGEELQDKTRNRSWKHIGLVDLALRMYLLSLTFCTCLMWPLVLHFEPSMPTKAINSLLLASLKESKFFVLLFAIIDTHVASFGVFNFALLNLLLFLSCEKNKTKGRAIRDSLRLHKRNHRPLRHAMMGARSIQLHILLTNQVSCWNVFAQKIIYIFVTVVFGYFLVREGSKNVISGIHACGSIVACIFSWWVTCYFANLVREETQILDHDIAISPGPFFKRDVRTFMRSVRRGYVQEGGFRAIERESFLIFVSFVVNQLVALLLM